MGNKYFSAFSALVIVLTKFSVVSDVVGVDTGDATVISIQKLNDAYVKRVECEYTADPPMKCWLNNCLRKVIDDAFTSENVKDLQRIASKAITLRADIGGPTIVDINTGYIRDGNGLDNLFERADPVYTEDDFETYGKIIRQLKQHVMESFELTELYFTAPTFITRLDGRPSWQAQEIHDEYWHVHADMNNTKHYHYSGLLYMSTYNEDFTGGRLHFVDRFNHSKSVEVVEPKAGRVVIFSSGSENSHFVERVTSGQRFVLAFWFTCTPSKQFPIFLDGNAHNKFSMQRNEQQRKGSGEL